VKDWEVIYYSHCIKRLWLCNWLMRFLISYFALTLEVSSWRPGSAKAPPSLCFVTLKQIVFVS
jgi:hypothetical protein